MKKIITIILSLILLGNTFANRLDTKLNNFFEKKEQNILFKSTIKQPYQACINEQKLYKRLIYVFSKAKNIDKYKKYKKVINYIINYTKNRSKYCKLVYNFKGEYHYFSFPISNNLLKDKSIFNKKFTSYIFGLLNKNNNNNTNLNNNNNTNLNNNNNINSNNNNTNSNNNNTNSNNNNTNSNNINTNSNNNNTNSNNINTNSNNINIKGDKNLKSLILQKDIEDSKKVNGNIILGGAKFKYNIPTVGKIEDKRGNFTIKINNIWISLKSISMLKVDKNHLNYGIKVAQEKYKSKFTYYYLNKDNKYNIYIIKNRQDFKILPFDLNKDFDYNKQFFDKLGILYFDNFLYTKKQNNHNVAWITNKNGKLYYIVLSGKGSYMPLKKEDYPKIRNFYKKGNIVLDNGNTLNIWTSGLKYFYIGSEKLYKKVNMKNLGDILYGSFYRIGKYNLSYNINDLYDLFDLAISFDGKKLSDLDKYIYTNIKYNKKINDLINKNNLSQDELGKEIKSNKNLEQIWNIFYLIKEKNGICETISDFFSFVSIINGLNANIVNGQVISSRYFHQISKVDNLYYDPTYDLPYKKVKNFGMNKNKLNKYFIEISQK